MAEPENPTVFPQDVSQGDLPEYRNRAFNGQVYVQRGGMSLRDYFAGQVIGMAAHDLSQPNVVAIRAYAIADAMLAERLSSHEQER